MEMYYVREYTPACIFLKIINSTLTGLVDYFKESTVGVYSPLHKFKKYLQYNDRKKKRQEDIH